MKYTSHQRIIDSRILKSIFSFLFLSLSIGNASFSNAEQRPDVVFILVDDLRYDALSCAGHPFVKTPHLDKLCKSGAWLENAFVTTSICCPSRATFLTGCYASRHGVIDNETAEYDGKKTPPLTKYLQEAGYSTAMIGKWHMGYSGRPRPTFDHWISFDGQGVYNNPKLNINGVIENRQGYITDLLTDYAVNYIEEQPMDRPFFLMLSHKAVHEPFQPAKRHKYDFGRERALPEPASWDDDFQGKPIWQRRERSRDARWTYRTRDREQEQVPDSVPPQEWDPQQRYVNQLRCISAIDESVAKLIETLRRRGTLENTLIVFTSDNGYFHLEHRRWDKRLAYDESMRIPMIVVYPGVISSGSSLSQLVANVDFAPTVLDYAGIKLPQQMQGRSLRPLFENSNAQWRDHVFYEYWTELVHSIPTMIAVRTDKYKLVKYPNIDDIDELYDLTSDPHEMTNLVSHEGHAFQHEKLKKILDQKMQDIGWKPRVFPPNLPRISDEAGPLMDIVVKNGELVDLIGSQQLPSISSTNVVGSSIILNRQTPPIRIPYCKKLDPSSWPFEIEFTFKAESDGVLFSQSGSTSALAFFVEDYRPVMTTRVKTWITSTTTIDGPKLTPGKWTNIKLVVDYNRIAMSVDGVLVEEVQLPLPFKSQTKSPMIIGGNSEILASRDCPDNPMTGLLRNLQVRRPSHEEVQDRLAPSLH